MDNPFDQFDARPAASANPFDQFDGASSPAPAPAQPPARPEIPMAERGFMQPVTPEGRPIVPNADGSFSTERTITVTDPSLNQGRPTNIPSMSGGVQRSEREAVDRVVLFGGADPETGRQLPSYDTIPAAVDAAQARSESLAPQVPSSQPAQPQATPAPTVPRETPPPMQPGLWDSTMGAPEANMRTDNAPVSVPDMGGAVDEYRDSRSFYERNVSDPLTRGLANLRTAESALGVLGSFKSIRTADRLIERQQREIARLKAELPKTKGAWTERTLWQIENLSKGVENLRAQQEEARLKLVERVGDIASERAAAGAIPRHPVAEAALRSESFTEFWRYFQQAPLAVIAEIGIESVPLMGPGIAAGTVGGVVAGPGGFAAGMGAGSGGVEFALSLVDRLEHHGADLNDPESVQRVLAEHGDEIQQYAFERGAVIGLVDAATGRMASMRLTPHAAPGAGTVERVVRDTGEGVAQVGAQAAGGSGGEALAQIQTEGRIVDPAGVAAEAAGEMVTGPIEVGAAAASGARERAPSGLELNPPSPSVSGEAPALAAPEAAPAPQPDPVIVTPPPPTAEDFRDLVEDPEPLIPDDEVVADAPEPDLADAVPSDAQPGPAQDSSPASVPTDTEAQRRIDENVPAAQAYVRNRDNKVNVQALAKALGVAPEVARGVLNRLVALGELQDTKQGFRRTAQSTRPQTLLEILSSAGGLRDTGGDLTAMDAGLWHQGKPGRRKLVNNETGIDLDRAVEIAVEQGYMRDPGREDGTVSQADINQLLELIGDELGGTPIYSAQDADRVAELRDQQITAEVAEANEAVRTEIRDFAKGFGETLEDDEVDANGNVLSASLSDGEFRGRPLEDVIGKTAAEKVMAAPEGRLEDEGLTVGGEGMKGFYDRMLPTFANKFGKKFGARVERAEIAGEASAGERYVGPVPSEEQILALNEAIMARASDQRFVSPITGERQVFQINRVANETPWRALRRAMGEGASFHEAMSEHGSASLAELMGGRMEAVRETQRHTVHSLPVTEKMRASALAGLPLFARQPARYTPTEKYQAAREQLREAIRAYVRRVAPHLKGLEFIEDDMIVPKNDEGERQAVGAGSYSRLDDIIRVSLEARDPARAARHEIIHHLRNIGVLTRNEWSLLEEKANAEWRGRYRIERRYGNHYDRFSERVREELYTEEAVADAYSDWNEGSLEVNGAIARIFQKIRQFWNRLRNLLRGRGFQTVDDVFAKIERGEGGARAGGRRGGETLYSIEDTPTPAHQEMKELDPQTEKEGLFGASFAYTPRILRDALKDRHLEGLARLSNIVSTGAFEATRNFQDSFLDLRDIQNVIARGQGRKRLPEHIDAYMAEELYHGRTGKRLDDFHRDHVEPLIEAINEAGVSLEEVNLYLYARHAPERNEQIAAINPEMPEGGSGMTDEEAAEVMAAFKERGIHDKLVEIAKRVDRITKMRREALGEYQLESDAVLHKWEQTYDHYVPLLGFEDYGDEVNGERPRTGRGFNIDGPESRRALGRQSKADNILAYVLAQYEETVIRGEKNLVGRTLLRLVQSNPNSEIWEVEPVVYTRRLNKQSGLVETVPDPHASRRDNVMSVKVAGKEVNVVMHHIPLATAFKNLGGASAGMLTRMLLGLNRYLAFINTSLNPEFGISNFSRDVQTATINLQGIDYARGLTGKILKDVPAAMRGVFGGVRGRKDTAWQKWFDEFSAEGGKIAFFGMDDIETRKARLERMMNDIDPSRPRQMYIFTRELLQFVQDVNAAIENATRLSTYKNLREAGVTRKRAAQIARNLTVNFNKRGNLGLMMNALYLFFNATIQGSAILVRALGHARVRKVVGGIVLGSVALDLVNAMLSPDDDDGEKRYDKINQWTKNHNLIIVNPFAGPDVEDPDDIVALKAPTPYGYNVFHVTGTKIGEVIRGKTDPVKAAADIAVIVVNSFNPLGGETDILRTVTPTAIKPALELGTNENFTTAPIAPEQNPYGVPKPNHLRYWNSVSEPARVIAKELSDLTGGDELEGGAIDLSPEWLDHMADFFTGGAGMFVTRSADFVHRMMQGDETPWNNVPIARRVVEGNNEWYTHRQYREIRDRVLLAEKKAKLAARRGGGETLANVRERNEDELRALPVFKQTEKVLKKLYEMRRVVRENRAIDDERKEERIDQIERRIRDVMRRALARQNAIAERNDGDE